MKVIYDRETDTLSILLRPGKVAESDEPRPGQILDYDPGRAAGVRRAARRLRAGPGPQSVEFALANGG